MSTSHLFVLPVLAVLSLLAPAALAAAPDGVGPWADGVVSSAQGLRKDGNPVAPNRSNASAAVGVAEGTNAAGTFFSLGFGGNIVLQFDNPISNGVIVVEATNNPYPNETALVQLSADGTNWITAGSVNQDGAVDMPERLSCARYAKLTDTSNPANFPDGAADGYDVDGVQATQGIPCDLPQVPEFGLITGLIAAATSTGMFLKMKGII